MNPTSNINSHSYLYSNNCSYENDLEIGNEIIKLELKISELCNARVKVLKELASTKSKEKKQRLELRFKELSNKLDALRERIQYLENAELELADKYFGDDQEEMDHLFGSSLLGKAIKNIAVVAATPVAMAVNFAQNHPYITAGIVIGTQVLQALSAPVVASQENNGKIKENRQQHKLNERFAAAIAECGTEEIPTSTCAEKLYNAWEENQGNLDRQIELEKIMVAKHKLNKHQDGYAKTTLDRAVKWYRCAYPLEGAATDATQEKCRAQVKHWMKISTGIVGIYSDSKLVNKENILDIVTKGNLSDPSYTESQRLEYARLSDYPYRQNKTAIPSGWHLNTALAEKIAESCNLIFHSPSGQITSYFGLTAYIFERNATETTQAEVCLSFGGTTAGLHPGDMKTRVKQDPAATAAHLIANIASTVSLQTPTLHTQARNLAMKLETEIQNRDDDCKFTITGHSLGAGLCTYAAGMTGSATKPTVCYGFSPAPIAGASQSDIAMRAGNVAHATIIRDNIKHTTIKGDPVPKVRNEVSGAHVVGEVTEIEATGAIANAGAGTLHGQFVVGIEEIIKERIILAAQEDVAQKTTSTRTQRDISGQGHKKHHHKHFTVPVRFEYETNGTMLLDEYVKIQNASASKAPNNGSLTEWVKAEANADPSELSNHHLAEEL